MAHSPAYYSKQKKIFKIKGTLALHVQLKKKQNYPQLEKCHFLQKSHSSQVAQNP